VTDLRGYDDIKARHNGAGQKESPLQLVHFGDMRAQLDGTPLVKGLLDRAQTSLIIGESGSGKTFLALDLALHVAAGLSWFGRRVTAGPVIYVAAEAGRSIENRVAAWRDHHGFEDRDLPFAAVISPVDLCHPEVGDVDRLITAVGKAGFALPALVIIDTVSRVLAGGNENGPDDMGALVRSLDRLRDDLCCHMSAVHHLGKDTARGSRGHSLLYCAVDTEITVAKDDKTSIATATVTKQRDGIAGGEIAFRLLPVELGRDQDGDAVTSCVVEPIAGETPKRRSAPSGQAGTALKLLQNAIAEAGGAPPDAVHFPAGRPIVPMTAWRRYCEIGGLAAGDTPDAFKKAFGRARDRLRSDGFIGIWDDKVWIAAPDGDKGT